MVAETPREFDASVSLIAASYGTPTTTYAGDYEGVIPALSWARDRYSVGASVGLYRILLNGLDDTGLGDVSVHAGVRLHADDHLSAGVMMMVSAPTGDEIIAGLLPPNSFPRAILSDHPERLRAVFVDSSNPANTVSDCRNSRRSSSG